MKIELNELLDKLGRVLERVPDIEIEVKGQPGAGSLAEAAKRAGLKGMFRWMRDHAEHGTPAEPANPFNDFLKNFTAELAKDGPAAGKDAPQASTDPQMQALAAAGAKGLEAFSGFLGKLVADAGDAAKTPPATTPTADTPKNAEMPKDMDAALVTAPSDTGERPDLPPVETRRGANLGFDIV